MLDIKTSYLGNYKNFKDYIPVCIMRYTPEWYHGITLKFLAPHARALQVYKDGLITFDEYTRVMQEKLVTKVNPFVIQKILQNINDKVVLVCICKDYNICHRKVVAEWLSKRLNINIDEL